MRNAASLTLILVLGLSVAACGKKDVVENVDVDERAIATDDDSGGGSASSSGLSGSGATSGESIAGSGGADDPLNQRVIYFDYDSASVTEDGRRIIDAHSSYLSRNRSINVVLEGHADERGTREYNLALGEQRAKAIARNMQALGVGAERIQIISYGEERPAALGHEESAWSLNRRVEILYSN